MRPVRIAAQLHPQHGDYPELRAAILAAEAAGFDIAYNWDHFFPLYGDPDGQHLECWTVLAAWAEATSRIELGPLVTCNSYRNPNLLADMARTVDTISGGRLILGIGSGWLERDYVEYGFEFGTTGGRLEALAAALPVIKHRLEALNPPPHRPPPILIAGIGERRTLPLVARFADAWHAGFPDRPGELGPKVAALKTRCAEIGRNPDEIECSVGVEPNDLDRFLRTDAATYLQMGFTQFTLGFNGPEWEIGAATEWLAWRDQQNSVRGPGR
jgi:probable F420-dependent oxidoreductase